MTDRQHMEESLRQSQAQLKGIIDAAMDALVTVDAQQNIVMFNAAAERMFRCPAASAIGSPLERFIPERFRHAHASHIANFGKTGVTNRAMGALGALKGLRANGEEFPLEASISQVEAGGNQLYTAIVRDVTERDRADRALREQASVLQLAQARLVSALEGGRMGTWVWDFSKNKITWDDAITLLFGRSAEELDHGSIEPFFSWLHPQDRDRARSMLETSVKEGTSYDAEYRLFRPDHSTVWIAARGKVERDEYGHPFRMTGVCIDITDRKKMEEELLQAQKMQSLGTLAGGIAHDFNNILLAIGGNASLAMEELAPDHPVQVSLHEIARAGTRASSLVRQLLAFSRRQTPDRKVVDIRAVVEEALALLRATLPARIEFRTNLPDNLPAVSADSTQLHRIIMNLGTNAARAIGEKSGTLEVTARTVNISPDSGVAKTKLKEGAYIRVCVSDDGCGMEPAILERIFDPFFTTQSPGQGTGLGLSVVHGIMKDHEGSVGVYSEPGKGATFSLYFPAIHQQQPGLAAAKTVPKGRGERILYIDDEEMLVLLCRRTLERLGYQVVGHVDPTRALVEFAANPNGFDALVTDLSMPGMSGADLARSVLKIRPDIPVVMMSGYIRPEDEAVAREIGVYDLILKPDTIEDLATALHRAFVEKSAGSVNSLDRRND